MATAEMSQTAGEFRIVQLSSLSLRDGFNPRTQRNPYTFAQTVRTVRETGVLSPIIVTPNRDAPGEFFVVAGEGRYLAAGEVGQTEVPVIVRSVDERTGGLEVALIENLVREQFDPVAEARGFAGLLAAGWTKKGVAEFFDLAQRRVTERLAILQLPETLHDAVASGAIPPSAVRPLVALGKLHPQLPEVVATRVGAEPKQSWRQPLTWPEVVEDPVGALLVPFDAAGAQLPEGIYETGRDYPLSTFALDQKATKNAQALARLTDTDPEGLAVRFGRDSLQQALALNGAYATANGFSHVVVGTDVAAQLAGDRIATQLKEARAEARRRREHDQDCAQGGTGGSDDRDAVPPSEEQLREQRRAAREAEQESRRRAQAYNAELGAAVLKHLSRVTPTDVRVVKLLAAVDVHGDLDRIEGRGAAYCLWPIEPTGKDDRVTVSYPPPAQAGAKAREFLDGLDTAADVTGRIISLLVLSRCAREECVAPSNRTCYEPRPGGSSAGLPWSDHVTALIDELARERLPEHLFTDRPDNPGAQPDTESDAAPTSGETSSED